LAVVLLVVAALVAAGSRAWRFAIRRAGRPSSGRGPAVILSLVLTPMVLYGAWTISRSRTFQLFGEIVPRVETTERVVALTFDDGPTPQFTEEVLSLLRDENVKATFFVTGTELGRNLALGQQIVAAGHELGNHSFSHRRMMGQSPVLIREEVERTDQLIREAGHQGPIHFRPPHCKKLLFLPYYLARTGRTTITWDIEPDSFAEVAAEPAGIAGHVRDRARPGSIILLHVMYPGRRTSMDAVPGIIRALNERGYRFATVSELLNTVPSPRRSLRTQRFVVGDRISPPRLR
jgi:chitin deacetylase